MKLSSLRKRRPEKLVVWGVFTLENFLERMRKSLPSIEQKGRSCLVQVLCASPANCTERWKVYRYYIKDWRPGQVDNLHDAIPIIWYLHFLKKRKGLTDIIFLLYTFIFVVYTSLKQLLGWVTGLLSCTVSSFNLNSCKWTLIEMEELYQTVTIEMVRFQTVFCVLMVIFTLLPFSSFCCVLSILIANQNLIYSWCIFGS